ncbi:hypothetical protein [Nitrosomonas communis]|uniref:Uncharacterized protein n=1 Tax=Nitrosomonas communis TaxID=44574 RepID=A0A1I4XP01_9PROT|nr:hypothetical protein [Nitrosomonas communis]SFN27123.1 hypothetical protein SAMN05421863_11662 [Nitrosomonas communis]
MSILIKTYEAVFEQYSAAMRRMAGLGIKLVPARTSHYEKVIGHWKDAYKTATADEERQIFPNFVSSKFGVFDFVSIYKVFGGMSAHQLTSVIEKLRKGVNGAINTTAKHQNSPLLAISFLKLQLQQRHITVVEILRPFSTPGQNKIKSNARKASILLETILAGQVGSGHCGIVILDVSKILNRGEAIYQGNLASLCGVAKIKGCVTSVSKKNRARMRHFS